MSNLGTVTSTSPSGQGVSITNAGTENSRCRGVYIGTDNSYDFSFDGSTWVEFQNALAGTVLPIQVVGARKNSDSSAPDAGDIVFLY